MFLVSQGIWKQIIYFRSKLEKFAEEEQTWIKRFQLSSKLSDRTRNLEKELSIQKKEVLALQKAVNDMQEALAQERKINTKICGENDRLRVKYTLIMIIL